MPGAGASRRLLYFVFGAFIVSILFISSFRNAPGSVRYAGFSKPHTSHGRVQEDLLKGGSIMPKLGNETAKKELGRAAWRVLHTTFARFPEKPTEDDSEALRAFIHLFQRLYPCGECSQHFKLILDKFPPQVDSRNNAAAWGCHVHNQVNKNLKKPEFDCTQIGDFYDCGCAEDEKAKAKATGKPEMSKESKEAITGAKGRDINEKIFLEKDGPTRGG